MFCFGVSGGRLLGGEGVLYVALFCFEFGWGEEEKRVALFRTLVLCHL